MNFKFIKSKRTKFRIIALILFLAISQPSFVQNTIADCKDVDPYFVYNKALEVINQKFYFKSKSNLRKWQNPKYKKEIKTLLQAHKHINKFLTSLDDPYTRFLTKEEFKEEEEIINSMLTGIGVKLQVHSPIILDVLPDSPANKEGIKPRDYILAINSISTHGLDISQVANLLRGPKETLVEVTLKRGHEVIKKVVKRQELNIKPISSQILEDGLALLKVDSFIPMDTSKVFKEELAKLISAKGLIIDLRNNSGGLLKNAVEIADMFLSSGKIVSTLGYFGNINEFANSNKLVDANVVVLVNEHTASASEILASALRENKRALVVGTKTFGKGLVQEVVELPDESALHVTIAVYLTPSGKNINKLGIVPDEIVYDDGRQLERAKEILLRKT